MARPSPSRTSSRVRPATVLSLSLLLEVQPLTTPALRATVSEPKPDVEYSQQVQSVNVGAANIPAPAQAAQQAAEQAGQEQPAQDIVTGNAEVATEGF